MMAPYPWALHTSDRSTSEESIAEKTTQQLPFLGALTLETYIWLSWRPGV